MFVVVVAAWLYRCAWCVCVSLWSGEFMSGQTAVSFHFLHFEESCRRVDVVECMYSITHSMAEFTQCLDPDRNPD